MTDVIVTQHLLQADVDNEPWARVTQVVAEADVESAGVRVTQIILEVDVGPEPEEVSGSLLWPFLKRRRRM